MKNILVEELKNAQILKFGEFILRSGEKSNYYCDIKQALGNPRILNLLVDELVKLIDKKVTAVVGSGYGGISLATLVAYKLKLPLILVRDLPKDHGTKKVIDGYVPNKKDIICIIDDVFTTGSSLKDTKEKLKYLKVKFVKPVVVLNRSNNKNINYILSFKDLES